MYAFSNNYISSAPLARGVNINKLLKTGRIFPSLDALPVAFNAVFTIVYHHHHHHLILKHMKRVSQYK